MNKSLKYLLLIAAAALLAAGCTFPQVCSSIRRRG